MTCLLKRVELVLETWGDIESAEDIRFNKPWMISLKAKLLLTRGSIHMCQDGNLFAAQKCLQAALGLDWESSAPRWSYRTDISDSTARAAFEKISREAPGFLSKSYTDAIVKYVISHSINMSDMLDKAYVLAKDEVDGDLTNPERARQKTKAIADSARQLLRSTRNGKVETIKSSADEMPRLLRNSSPNLWTCR